MADDFDSLLEESLKDPQNAEALREKLSTGEIGEALPVGEVVKDYPKPQRELDLHGHTGSEAMFELEKFLEQAAYHHLRTVRVVTGKGLHSAGFKSVLPELTERRLGELRCAKKVLTFKREKSGGAFLVYLVS